MLNIPTSVDMRQGTAFGRTGQICQQIHRTLCHVHAVVEDRGRDHHSAIVGSGMPSAFSRISRKRTPHVCTTVKDDWQRSRWVNTGTKSGKNKLGDRYQNASNTCSNHKRLLRRSNIDLYLGHQFQESIPQSALFQSHLLKPQKLTSSPSVTTI